MLRERRLARARAADDRDDARGLDPERHAGERRDAHLVERVGLRDLD